MGGSIVTFVVRTVTRRGGQLSSSCFTCAVLGVNSDVAGVEQPTRRRATAVRQSLRTVRPAFASDLFVLGRSA